MLPTFNKAYIQLSQKKNGWEGFSILFCEIDLAVQSPKFGWAHAAKIVCLHVIMHTSISSLQYGRHHRNGYIWMPNNCSNNNMVVKAFL